jgi:hypothetical protein
MGKADSGGVPLENVDVCTSFFSIHEQKHNTTSINANNIAEIRILIAEDSK